MRAQTDFGNLGFCCKEFCHHLRGELMESKKAAKVVENVMSDFVPVAHTDTNRIDAFAVGTKAPMRREATTVLIADNDPSSRLSLEQMLQDAGHRVLIAADGHQARQLMSDEVQVAIFDLHLPLASGLECLQVARDHFPDTQVMIMANSQDTADAVTAVKQGAFEFVAKPIQAKQFLAQVTQAAKAARLAREHRGLKEIVSAAWPTASFSSETPAAKILGDQVERLAQLDSTVLITGESGTGKTTIARMIHQRGNRADRPFVAINCASLPRELIEAELFGHERGAFTGAITDRPGRAEIANGGTLFLDEIGDLPMELQPKLLTFLQDRTFQRIGSNRPRTVDVRVIVATLRDLGQMCRERLFREDLYYRLNVLGIAVPPLRDRRDEIPHLIRDILQRIARRRGNGPIEVTKAAIERLCAHHWPGNIRELENVLERSSAYSDSPCIDAGDISLTSAGLPGDSLVPKGGFVLAGKTLAEIERQAIIDTLRACNGNKAMTARTLGISEKSIYNKMKRLEITSF